MEPSDQPNRQCEFGRFYSDGTNTCEDCNRLCPNGNLIENCGKECVPYFSSLKKDLQNEETSQKMAALEEHNEELSGAVQWLQNGVIALTTCICVFVLGVAVFQIVRKLWKRRSSITPVPSQYKPVKQELSTISVSSAPKATAPAQPKYTRPVTAIFDKDNMEYTQEFLPISGSILQAHDNRRESMVEGVVIGLNDEPPSGGK